MSNLLFLDIETLPGTAYVWSLWGENVPLDRMISPSRTICWAAKWNGRKEITFRSEWEHGRALMLDDLHTMMSEADAVVTYNGDKFDLPKVMGEFARDGLWSTGPITSIDLYKTARKLGYISNKLEFVSKHLAVGEKMKHEGFKLWAGVAAGDEKCQNTMRKYNIQDVVLLERLYKRLRPFIKNHPFLGDRDTRHCPTCESPRLQKRGVRRTRNFIVERVQCQSCGAWSDGAKRKVA